MKRKSKPFPGSLGVFFEKLPLAIIAGIAGFAAVVIVLLLCGQFHTELIWTIGTAMAALCAWGVFRLAGAGRPGSGKENLICDIIVLVGVLAWGGYNMLLTSQHVRTNRDPATYAVTSSWLSERTSFEQEATKTLSEVPGVHVNSAGFSTDKQDGTLYPQGQHALPALLGAMGKFVGPVNVLHLNVIFGMTALLAVYCFARIFMLARWAIVATGIMGLTLPLLYFSRDTYTEPLALTLTFGGLALIAIAQKKRSLWLWAIAGLVFSSSLLARVDAYLALIGVAAFFIVYIALTRKDIKRRLSEVAAFALPAVGMGILAWLDLKLLSPSYYESTESLVTLELLALGGLIVVGAVGIGLLIKFPQVLQWLHRATKQWRAALAATGILLIGVFLALLPLWYAPQTNQMNDVVAEIQRENGWAVEPYRYLEFVGYWVSWYIGPIVAVLGIVGLAYAAYRSMHDKNLLFLCALFVILGTSVVYFWQPSITPDQIWASRRMLPVIMPGVVVFGVYALGQMAQRITLRSAYFKGAVLVTGAAMLLVAPLLTSAPFVTKRLTAQYKLVDDICNNLPKNGVVVWLGLARLEMIQPTRTYCHVEAYGYHYKNGDTPSRQTLAAIAKKVKQEGKVPYLGVYRHQYGGLIDTANQRNMTEIGSVDYNLLVRTLTEAPSEIEGEQFAASLGVIQSDGSIKRIDREEK